MFPRALRVDDPLPLRAEQHVAGGSFGDVYKLPSASLLLGMRVGGGAIAVKLPRSSVRDRRKVLCRAIREALTWSLLSHENIIPLHGVGADLASQRLCLLSQWMPQGNIRQYLSQHPDADRQQFMQGIARGLTYLHELVPPIVHGDLKGNNVLISPSLQPLLSDFGLSTSLSLEQGRGEAGSSSYVGGNARWAPPERLTPEEYGLTMRTCVTLGGDVFSLLRTFLEILTDAPPFAECANDYYVIQRVMARFPPARPASPEVTDRLWELMSFAWSQGPFDRPTAREVLDYLSLSRLHTPGPALASLPSFRKREAALYNEQQRAKELETIQRRQRRRLHQHAKKTKRERTYYVVNEDVMLKQVPRNAGGRVKGPRSMRPAGAKPAATPAKAVAASSMPVNASAKAVAASSKPVATSAKAIAPSSKPVTVDTGRKTPRRQKSAGRASPEQARPLLHLVTDLSSMTISGRADKSPDIRSPRPRAWRYSTLPPPSASAGYPATPPYTPVDGRGVRPALQTQPVPLKVSRRPALLTPPTTPQTGAGPGFDWTSLLASVWEEEEE
ncbi:kinase-like protein [Calocera viscosa TUFC12733]|uniref:Kinase-like protein n=1 Tax=Calocera viscosa (strain TUFC12733) TaxID=1330018 RepID=A0A167NB70_CALVF|nr:kinase-like protein [Calocera viscosa TUFC12733]